jgi:hypothetical protein
MRVCDGSSFILVCAALLVTSATIAEAGDAYTHSVHVEKNDGTINFNDGTTINYYVKDGVTQDMILSLAKDIQGQARSLAQFQAQIRTAIASLNQMTSAQLASIQQGISSIEAAVRDQAATGGETKVKVDLLQLEMVRLLRAVEDGNAQRAQISAERAQKVTEEFDQRWGFGARAFAQSILLVSGQPRVPTPDFLFGGMVRFDVANFDPYHRQTMLVHGGIFGGYGGVVGGYESPGRKLLSPVSFTSKPLFVEAGASVRLALGLRTSAEVGLAFRYGRVEYTSRDGSVNVNANLLQVPLTLSFVYKPVSWLSMGLFGGGGPELFASSPLFVYTGVGANVSQAPSQVRASVEGGAYAAYRW